MSPCSKIKQLRQIVSSVLEEDELSFNHYRYCNRKLTMEQCYGSYNAKPLACQSIPVPKNCKNPISVIVQGEKYGNRTKDGNGDWTEHITPGGTLCIVDDSLSGTCVKFKDRFTSTEKEILAHGKRMPGPKDLPIPIEGTQEEQRLNRWQKNKYINPADVILGLAESVCRVHLTTQAVTLWKNGKVRKAL